MDNMMSISLNTPRDVQRDLADRFKTRRLAVNLTQEGLAARSGVSWSSLKRFERTGLIALDSLLKLALVLGCLNDFDRGLRMMDRVWPPRRLMNCSRKQSNGERDGSGDLCSHRVAERLSGRGRAPEG